MTDYSLTSAELAVLVDHMTGGALGDRSEALVDLDLDPAEFETVEDQLIDDGLLISLPFEAHAGVTSELASVLSAAITPDQVCILRQVHREHTDPPVIFSFSSECITRNTVDGDGRHSFSELGDRERALSAILEAGGVSPETQPATSSTSQPLDEILENAERLVTLIIAEDPAEVAGAADSLAWVDARAELWLVEGAGDAESPLALPIDYDGLRERVEAALSRHASAPTVS